MTTNHNIYIGASQQMIQIEDNSIDLVVTSPPYPMIEMWDEIMINQNNEISNHIYKEPYEAFELMHKELDKVWSECFRVIKDGGFLCINVGDATRTINGQFTLYNNHSRITNACIDLGFTTLPNIIWRKQTNAPNKFMGSGMLPCGAYVTLEHEWILIFRKGSKRIYKTDDDKVKRMESAFFFEERNVWFSDVWNVKGTTQKMQKSNTRERSAAFPLEIPYRLINMFSQQGDNILDPFLGTGTTMQAAILTGRNSYGYEIDSNFEHIIRNKIESININEYNEILKERINKHIQFIIEKEQTKQPKYFNNNLQCKVITKQETKIKINLLKSFEKKDDGKYKIIYENYS